MVKRLLTSAYDYNIQLQRGFHRQERHVAERSAVILREGTRRRKGNMDN
jgi:hypothetical protein